MENLTDEKQSELFASRRRKAEEILMEIDKNIVLTPAKVSDYALGPEEYAVGFRVEADGWLGEEIRFIGEKIYKKGLRYKAPMRLRNEEIRLENLDGSLIGKIKAKNGEVYETAIEDKVKITVISPKWTENDGMMTNSQVDVNGESVKQVQVFHSAKESADDAVNQIYNAMVKSKQKAAEQNQDNGREM